MNIKLREDGRFDVILTVQELKTLGRAAEITEQIAYHRRDDWDKDSGTFEVGAATLVLRKIVEIYGPSKAPLEPPATESPDDDKHTAG